MALAVSRWESPLLGVLGGVCEATTQVADREVARQTQAAPEYERWILQALSDASGPHWMPCDDREAKCSAASTVSGIMQHFLSMCQERPEDRYRSENLQSIQTMSANIQTMSAKQGPKVNSAGPAAAPSRIPPPKASPLKRACRESSSAETLESSGCPNVSGPDTASKIPVLKASPAKRPCWQESSPVEHPRSPGPDAASKIPVLKASPAKRPCWQESSPVEQSPGESPKAKETPSASSKRRFVLDDFASPISERVAQAPSPIRAVRALQFGPAKKGSEGEAEEALLPPGESSRAVAEAQVEVAERLPKFGPSPAAPAAPAAFAQDSIIEPTEEVHVPRPAEWQSKALFEKPPDSPMKPLPNRPKPAGKPPLAELPQASPERKELTPMKVADRIMMFEKIISPSVRVAGAAMSSSARLGKPVGSANRGSATCSHERSSGRAVDGSSLFTPVQPAWARPDVKPKELFRSNSDLALRPPSRKAEPKAKTKLTAPPRGKPPGGAPAHQNVLGVSAVPNIQSGFSRDKESERETADRPPAGQKREMLKPQMRVQEAASDKKVPVVPVVVPLYRDPALEIRAMVLPPKNPEDNYVISEYGGDSEGEDAAERDKMRQKKAVPKWCVNYISVVQQQQGIDPDSIFGRVPRCVMDDVFQESLYMQVGKKRPARRRGSSGDWKRDRLTRNEIRSYKQRMGHKRSWDQLPERCA